MGEMVNHKIKKATVLVTGANGLLATNLIAELVDRDYRVKGFLRNKKKYNYIEHEAVELIEGDLRDEESLSMALENCDYVIHTAAVTDQKLPTYLDYSKINVEGTERLIQLAIKAKVKKFIQVSSAGAFGYGSIDNLGNESWPIKYPFSKSFYTLSKLEGQNVALKYKDQLDVVVINPTFMLGAYDSKPSSGKILQYVYNRSFVLCPPGGKNFVHVQDVAIGAIKAIEKGRNGEAYILSNENLSYEVFYKKMFQVMGQKTRYYVLPKWIVLAIGCYGNFIKKIGFQTNQTLTNMKSICIRNYYSNEKARRELGMEFQQTENAIESALKWLEKHDMINKKPDIY